jgi:UDP-N-acetylglucosamine 2-epimerase (non-hydrolysing)
LEAFDAGPLDGIEFHEPFGYFDYVRLQTQAKCVLSDSGTISEESAILGFPAVTLRESIERPEALDVGSILLATLRGDAAVEAIHAVLNGSTDKPCPSSYLVANASRRVTAFILSTVHQSHAWSGIRPRSEERR